MGVLAATVLLVLTVCRVSSCDHHRFISFKYHNHQNYVQDLLLSCRSYEMALERKKGDILIGLLSLIDIIVLISMSASLSAGTWNYLVFAFDALVVSFIMFSYCRRLRESQQRRKYLIGSWYEIFGMRPIAFFAVVGQLSNDYDGYITFGTML